MAEVNKKYLKVEVIVVIQINGKRRGEVNVKKDCQKMKYILKLKTSKT